MKHLFTLLLITVVFFSEKATAQGQGNIWYFGNYAGLDFNSGSPVVLNNSAMSAFEGCSSIADENGNLLFYTDGMTVWNMNHQVMYNGTGLYGNSSSTQSGVIVPLPGNPDVYYVFTVDAQLGTWGLRYSIVDMSLQSGLGEVTDKNIPIYTPSTEKITATAKSYGEYWIMTHQWNNNIFSAYVLDGTGLSASATTTSVGTIMSGSNASTIGYMKFSPDGNRLGYSIDYDLNRVEIFDFDKTTGTVSNSLVLGTNFPGYGPYGFEFSPNSQVVYMANEGLTTPNASHVYQWDLQAGTSSQIIASMVTLGAMNNAGALQLAPDGKIYLVQTNTNYMGVVNDPDVPGSGCNFVQNSIDLSPGGSNYGLPNFVTSFFLQAAFTFDGICFGDSTTFEIVDSSGIDSVLWVFDDPVSGLDSSTEWSPFHIFSSADTFSVQLYYYFQDTLDTAIVDVVIYPHPDTNLGPDTAICLNDVITLDASYPDASYLWMDGTIDSTHAASLPGLYYVEVTSVEGCITRDSILITNHPLPVVDLGNDTLICDGQTLTLDVTNSGVLYLWQDGSVNPQFTISSAGL
ncbi:MAG: beta-propeller fold lactonase family protein, partial [Bacteroidetes bacterium]|nr:beta-propeller fold lactonase family protein [Bacteroidota bacterium]